MSHFSKTIRESKLTVNYTKYSNITIQFRLSKTIKKCLNYQMRVFTSFHMSYQQHTSEHCRANCIRQQYLFFTFIQILSQLRVSAENHELQIIQQELFQKNKGFASNLRWGQMYTPGIRRVWVNASDKIREKFAIHKHIYILNKFI